MDESILKWLQDVGRKGGLARAANLTAEQRSASARKAVRARIKKYGQKRRKSRAV